jgi:hypothetical protein
MWGPSQASPADDPHNYFLSRSFSSSFLLCVSFSSYNLRFEVNLPLVCTRSVIVGDVPAQVCQTAGAR